MTQVVPLVLIAEDDTQSLYLMERYIRRSGCQPIATTQGHKALELARQEQPAIIFLDLRLPDISGWEVLHALKADLLTQNIPVIICTGVNEVEEADRALKGGAGYLHKPIYYQDFLNALADEGIEVPNLE